MRAVAVLALLAACGDDGIRIEPDADDGNPLDGVSAPDLIADGFQYLEGPQWVDFTGELLFSDIPADRIYRHVPLGPAPSVFRMPSHRSNGLAIINGLLTVAEQESRSITNENATLVANYGGMALNGPNDIVGLPPDTFYFTDPVGNLASELGFNGVFRYHRGTLYADHRGGPAERPNGVALSPDRSRLYVTDTMDGNLYSFPVSPLDGALGAREVLATTSGVPDGIAVDERGNLYVAAMAGIEVYAPTGVKWGVIPVPMAPSNVAFGTDTHRALFVTARTALYRIEMRYVGLPNN